MKSTFVNVYLAILTPANSSVSTTSKKKTSFFSQKRFYNRLLMTTVPRLLRLQKCIVRYEAEIKFVQLCVRLINHCCDKTSFGCCFFFYFLDRASVSGIKMLVLQKLYNLVMKLISGGVF